MKHLHDLGRVLDYMCNILFVVLFGKKCKAYGLSHCRMRHVSSYKQIELRARFQKNPMSISEPEFTNYPGKMVFSCLRQTLYVRFF